MSKGAVKWFNESKGFGFITDWRFEGEKEATTPWWDFGSYNVGLQPAKMQPLEPRLQIRSKPAVRGLTIVIR